MAADDFDRMGGTAGFSLDSGIKDVGHMRTLAFEHKVSLALESSQAAPTFAILQCSGMAPWE